MSSETNAIPSSSTKPSRFQKYQEAGVAGSLRMIWEDRQSRFWVIAAALTMLLIYAYWNSLTLVADTWNSPQYSHGFLIPIFAAVLLWLRREPIKQIPIWHLWVGCGLIAFGLAMRMIGTRTVIFTVDFVSILPCLAGVVVLAGGLNALKWAAAPLLFLLFMFPLPDALVDGLLKPLQKMATVGSCFALQTLGMECHRVGNNIHMAELVDKPLGVVDQCSGLRMVTIFLALSVAIAMIATNRPWWERLIVVASAIPIAILVNVIRITLTGLLYSLKVDDEIANKIFHDYAGYIMMPMALGFLYLEMQILSKIVVEAPEQQIVRARTAAVASPGKAAKAAKSTAKPVAGGKPGAGGAKPKKSSVVKPVIKVPKSR